MSPSRRHAYLHAVRASRLRSRSARIARVMSVAVGVTVMVAAAVSWLGRADAAGPGTGVIVYSDGATNEPWVRDWNGSAWSAASPTGTIHEWRVAAGAASRTRDEMITVGVNIHNDIRGEVWNGTSWAEFPFGTVGGVNQNYWWSQDVAYERLSDDALMVWANGSTGSIPISYRVWNGTSWTAEQTITTPVAGVVRQLHLAPSPDSDEMVLVVSDGLSRDYAFVWNGSAWSDAVVLSASGGTDDRTDVYVAYEQQSGEALVAYGTSATSLHFRTWNGAAWSTEGSVPIPAPATGNVRWATLASDPGTDRVGVGVTTFDGHSWLAVWDGTAWGSALVATQSASGTIFPSIALGFESSSGQLVAIYGEGTSMVQYRTWTGAGGWSAQTGAFDVGDTPNTMMLDSDPFSDRVMASVQDAGSDLSASLWTGSGWGAVTQLESDTREVKNQPWVFLWSRQDLPPALNGLGDYRDELGTVAYDGSDGFLDWTSDSWVEIGDGNGAATPQVYVATRDPNDFKGVICPDGLCLIIDDLQATALVRGASRVADLSEATTATFSFTYSMENDGGSQGTFYAEVRDAGNPSWTRLATYVVTGNVPDPIAQSFDITAHISAATEIRFISAGTGSSDEFFVDDVTITLYFGDRTDDEGEAVSFAIDGSDPFGDEITFSASGLPPGVGIHPVSGVVSGTISQTAASGSPYAVVIKVADPAGNADSAAFNWTVNPINVPPILADPGDQVSDEGTAISLVWSATDEDIDTLTWTATGLPPGLSIDPDTGLVSGTIGYTAAAGSPYAYKVRVTDDGAPSLFAEVSGVWTVTNVNREPQVVHPGDQTNAEGDVVSFVVTAVDPDGDGLTWSATGLPSGLSIDPVTGSVSGAISYASSGGSPYFAVITAHDDGSPSAAASISVTWTVTNTNRAPVVTNPGDRSNAEGDTVTFAMLGSDPDGDTLTWSASGLPSGLSIDPSSGVISGMVGYDGSGTYVVSVRATDDGSPSLFGEVGLAWVVSGTNRTPVVTAPGPQSSAEGAAVSLAMVGSDPDLDGITWSASGLPPGLGIDAVTGVISGSLSFEAAGTHAVVVRATDDGSPALSAEVPFSWSVSNTNREPQSVSPGARSNAEGDPVAFALVGSDPDGDTLTWSASGLPAGVSIDPASGVISGSISYEAAPGSPYLVTVRVTDDGSPVLFGEVSFAWAVSNTNREPVVSDPGLQTSAEGDVVLLAMVGSDPDGDGITWSASVLPAGLSIDPSSGVISGTVRYDAAGTHVVTVRATDDASPALLGEVSLTWSVSNTNQAPAVSDPGSRSNAEGDPVTVAMVGSDPDGDGITWSASGLPSGLSIDPTSGVISGTVGFEASAGSPYSVVVRATDDGAPVLFDEVSFSWSIANTNRAPVVTGPAVQSTPEGRSVALAVSGSDPDGDTLTWSASALPQNLVIDPATGMISGTLSFESAGLHSVTVQATDPEDAFTEVSFLWVVSSVNRAPVLVDPGDQTTAEGTAVSLAIVGSDPDGDGVTFSAEGLPPGLSIDPVSGAIAGTLGYDLVDRYAVVVTVVDDGSPMLVSQAAFAWVIGEVNRPPVIVPLADRTAEVGEDTRIEASGSDPDGDQVAWSATGLPTGVTISPVTGVISGIPQVPGAYGVTVSLTDDGSPPLRVAEFFAWTVVSPPGFPAIEPIVTRRDLEDTPVSFVAGASHPDELAITWSASGLPSGITIDAATGEVSGVPDTVGTWLSRITVTDSRGQQATASFVWTVESAANLPPVAGDDIVIVGVDELTSGGIAIDAAGNDSDPEGERPTVTSVSQPESGAVELSGGMVVFYPPEGWLGTVTIGYTVQDESGNEADGTITVTVVDSLRNRLGTTVIAAGSGPSGIDLEGLGGLTAGDGTEMLLGSIYQSLHVLRVPLALLGGAVFWSLLLGGSLNLGFVLRGGIPRLVRRTSRHLAVVLVPHGGRVDVLSEPGRGAVVARLTATERGMEATGRRVIAPDGEEWVELRVDAGMAWIPAFHASEEVDRSGFATDVDVLELIDAFMERLRTRRDFSDLVSERGLFVAHHASVIHFPPDRLPGIMEDPTLMVWKGRNPAYPDFSGTFDLAVATSVLDAFDHPQRELLFDHPTTPATVIPVEFTNLHYVSVGADVHGPERLDQSAWIIAIAYESSQARIIGLVREG